VGRFDDIKCCGESDRRVVCWFSCGSTSAIATKLALKEYRDHDEFSIVYTDPGSEHPDNMRFLKDCEEWFEHPVTILRSDKYKDTWDVFEKTRYLAGPMGARCTVELKKVLRVEYQQPDDIHIFGFDVSERRRVERFQLNNPDVDLRTPLIDANLTKPDCMAMLERAGIELPAMYRLGFPNANCIGCSKAEGAGYWNQIRRVFPETFDRMAKVERELNSSCVKRYEKNPGGGKDIRIKVFLDELDPDAGADVEVMPDCSILCAIAESELEDG